VSKFLKVNKTKILDSQGKPVALKGVNLGGWLMMEGYLLFAPNNPERYFRNNFKKALGEKALLDFDDSFRKNFITELDFKNIKKLGFNCVRIPFHHRLVESKLNKYSKSGVKFLDDAIKWAKKNKLFVILDLHGAAGCQNHDWHSDSFGKAELWTNKNNQKRTLALWKFLADRYKNEECVAGYDLMNESVVQDIRQLNSFYKQIIETIRSVDRNHILFIEGNNWSTDINCLDEFEDDNYALSIHSYEPLDFTFNFVPHLKYPTKVKNSVHIKRHISQYKEISKKRDVPVLVGEFGVNYRDGFDGEDKWLEDNLKCFNNFGFHWTYWTYKAIKGFAFPDGVYSYYDNPSWVNRVGPLFGWDTYHLNWKKNKSKMIESWKTKNFKKNKTISKVLKKYAK